MKKRLCNGLHKDSVLVVNLSNVCVKHGERLMKCRP